MTEPELQEHLSGLQGWMVENGLLQKKFRFKTFMEGIQFVNRVAEVAEAMDHHPDITIRFGLINIALVTHCAKGITTLDFEQARKLDQLG
jgi:4a-hydroxytetrahydrobiopterin dehydratase